ncbi:MAG: glycosyltransferase family 4 protein [Sphingobacteriia bacterium]
MRILCLHQYFCPPTGWGNDRSYQLMQHWADAGLGIRCITSKAYFPDADDIRRPEWRRYGQVEVLILPVAYQQSYSRVRKIWAYLRFAAWAGLAALQERPDVLWVSITPPPLGWVGGLLRRLMGVPLVLEVVEVWPEVPQGMGLLQDGPLRWLLKRLARWTYLQARQVYVLSPGMAAQLQPYRLPAHISLSVSLNGTDLAQFVPRSAGPVGGPPPLRMVYTGALGQANAVHEMILALYVWKTAGHTHWSLDLYGWGKEAGLIAQLIQEYRLADQVRLHAPVTKAMLNERLQQAHLGLVCFAPHAVLEANSANKFYDYLAAGLPVLLNYRGWQAELVEQHRCGYGCPQGDWKEWLRRLDDLAADPDALRTMRANARQLATAQFDRLQLAQQQALRFRQLAAETAGIRS